MWLFNSRLDQDEGVPGDDLPVVIRAFPLTIVLGRTTMNKALMSLAGAVCLLGAPAALAAVTTSGSG